MKKDFYIVYQTTNMINGKIYVGVHETNNIEDNYLGSGLGLLEAFKKYGRKNFTRKILYFCKDKFEMYKKETKIVNEKFVKRNDTYNRTLGGNGGTKYKLDDNGNLVGVHKGRVTVKDKEGNIFHCDIKDPRYLSGELVPKSYGRVNVKDKNGNGYCVDIDDTRYLSGELVHVSKGQLTVKDELGNTFSVKTDDPRYLSGELVHVSKGNPSKTKYMKWMTKEGKNIRVIKNNINEKINDGWILGKTTVKKYKKRK